MKSRPTKIKLVELMFLLLWFGAFINAQSEEPLRESKKLPNSTTITRVRSSVVVGIVKSVRPAQPQASPKMNYLKTQTAVRLQNSLSVKATRTFFNSSMRAMSTTLVPPTKAPMTEGGSKLGLIIGCVVAGIVLLVLFSSLLCYYRRKAALQRREPESESWEDSSRRIVHVGAWADSRGITKSADSWRGRQRGFAALPSSRRIQLRAPDFTTEIESMTPKALFYDDEDDTDITYSKERLSRNISTHPRVATKMITTQGDAIEMDDILLQIFEGCLKQDTEITLIKVDQIYDFKSLLNLGLVDAPPWAVFFFPDGLKFLKPANLRIRFEKPVDDSELFVLHGSYNRDIQRRVWELVTNDLEENSVEGFVDVKIHGFSVWTFFFSLSGIVARILSHLNYCFCCSACVLYRREPSSSTSTIDIVVVICSEFVENEGEMKQVNRLIENGYTKGEHGMFKLVHTDRSLEMFVNFPDVETTGFQFNIDLRLLDTVGYVVDNFMGMAKEQPASGVVKINEIQRSEERKPLWTLRFREVEEEVQVEREQALSAAPGPSEESTSYQGMRSLYC